MRFPDSASKKNAIAKAADYALGNRLHRLYELCETQKTISTNKLSSMINELHEEMKLDAIFLREVAKKMRD